MPTFTTKQARIAAGIRRRILAHEWQAGEPIPSYRALVAEHGVAVATVRQAVGALQAEGLVRSVPGRGCVVAAPVQQPRVIAVVTVGRYQNQPLADTLVACQPELREQQCEALYYPMGEADAAGVARLIALGRRLDGLVLQGKVPVALLRALNEAGVRAVLMGLPVDGPVPRGTSVVTVDVPATVAMGVGMLAGLGHRRIALVRSRGSYYFDELSRAFQECARASGLADAVSEVVWSLSDASGRRPFPEVLRELPQPPTAVLVDSAVRAMRIMDDLTAAAIAVPEQVSILAISERPAIDAAHQHLARVEVSMQDLLLRASALLLHGLDTGERVTQVENLLPRYLAGPSCRPPAVPFPITTRTPSAVTSGVTP